jgi:tetratricopeptide (TPR) repeat protein
MALGELNFERQILMENWPEARAMVDGLKDPGSRKSGASRSLLSGFMASGQLAEARSFAGEAWRAADEAKDLGHMGWTSMVQAWIERRRGASSKLAADQVPQMERSFMLVPNLALVSVELGTPEPLAAILRRHETDLKDSRSRFVVQETQFIRGCQALIAGRPEEARTLMEPLARNSILLRRHHVLATTYETLGKWTEAAAEYEEILKYRYRQGYLVIPTLMALDRYRAARVYERLHNEERARQWYAQFLAGWKNADPDIPEVIDAKQRLAALGGPAAASQ